MGEESRARGLVLERTPERFETISRYVDILTSRGLEWGLLGPREAQRIWERHILNSLTLSPLIESGRTVADVGSGAGLPGIVLAIQRPDLAVTLVEPLLRRSEFLSLAIDELGLSDHVQVIRARAEELRASFDVVTCRAVAPLRKLLPWCAPLFGRGELLALKGQRAEQEVAEASRELARSRLQAEVVLVDSGVGFEPARVIRVWRP